ncbi:uncharacterized protein LOC121718472 [Alosa sapidissima]|uniref:uncharacterized protein LOC121718472 n=1 Tax=Alosa sapidissima TaxID=34773 RepID=UPI001C08B5FD|nr:uncharacterized protein LOC121718472 [Alosa sapidissima]
MKEKEFQREAEVACFLLDREEHLSAIAEAPMESPEQSLHDMSLAEADMDENVFNDPMNSVLGGALKGAQHIHNLPIIGLDETVHDLPSNEDRPDELLPNLEMPILPDPEKVLCEDDIIGVKAAITYENSMKQLVTFLALPVDRCTGVLRTGQVCDSVAPFHTNISFKGTAMSVEWICPNGHCLWRWNSQPLFKFGMQAWDFLLSTNLLLAGNNYAKVALLFKYMNMGMVNPNTFFTIQDTYCVDTVKEFWEEQRSEVISQLQGKDVVLLSDGRNDSPGHCAQL